MLDFTVDPDLLSMPPPRVEYSSAPISQSPAPSTNDADTDASVEPALLPVLFQAASSSRRSFSNPPSPSSIPSVTVETAATSERVGPPRQVSPRQGNKRARSQTEADEADEDDREVKRRQVRLSSTPQSEARSVSGQPSALSAQSGPLRIRLMVRRLLCSRQRQGLVLKASTLSFEDPLHAAYPRHALLIPPPSRGACRQAHRQVWARSRGRCFGLCVIRV